MALADAASKLLTDPDLHARQSEASRARAVEHFSRDRVLEQYYALYRRVLER